MLDQGGKDRRRFQRHPFEQKLECQFIFDSQISETREVRAQNISQAGLLVEYHQKIPIGATITFAVNKENLKGYLEIQRLKTYIEIEVSDKIFVKLCGKVVRVQEISNDLYKIAIHLINK